MSIKSLAHVVKGMATYIPGLYKFSKINKGTGGTTSARYCYSVWLRHLVIAYANGLKTMPKVIAELGPGDSLGVGLAALLSGVNRYYAFDIIRYAGNKRNIEILDELVDLFRRREKIPDGIEFPQVKPHLKSYEFPNYILTDGLLAKALRQRRVELIKKALTNSDYGRRACEDIQISYVVPWYDSQIIKEGSVDMLYSQAVLEHIQDLNYTYTAMYKWLKPQGFISHEIDFKSHGKAVEWNGHWAYSDFTWSLIKGKRPYLLNRQPHSKHISFLKKAGFKVVCDIKTRDVSGISRRCLAPRFKDILDDDLVTCDVLIQAIKK